MKCPSCSAEVADGARFCNQCGTSLAGVCPACGAQNNPAARFCSECGARLAEHVETVQSGGSSEDPAGDVVLPYAERRQLTVLFSDIVGSTSLSEQLDPEDLRAILHDYQSACSKVIGLYDGHLAKYLGDGILAYFGYPTAHEDDAQRAARAGLGIVQAIQSLGPRYQRLYGTAVDVRIGIHTGLVVVGDMDQADVLESNAIVGQTPNLAARIQSEADPNALLVSNDTRRLISDFFEFEDCGLHELKGISQPIHLFQVVHETSARNRIEAMGARLTPLKGREEEMSQLRRRWERATEGHGQVALLGGEPGIGKSRLVFALKAEVSADPDARIMELRCSPFYQNSALQPFVEFLERDVLSIEHDDSPETRLSKIDGLVAQYLPDAENAVALLATLLSVPLGADRPPLLLSPQRIREKTIELLLEIILARVTGSTVLFVLEDLHWADPSTLELLDKLIERGSEQQLLVLMTHRPVFQPYWPPQSNMVRIELTGLTPNDARAVILRAAGDRPVPEEAVVYILKKTDGIPLFLEEFTKMMVESKFLIPDGDGLRLAAPLESLAVPSTLQDSLTARLDRLPEAKPVAQLGAIIGREFSYELLEHIPGAHRKGLTDNLSRLVDAGVLFQKGSLPRATFLFKHALIQDSAYSSLLKTARRSYHKLVAEAIENSFSELVDTQPELLAHHYTNAGETVQAASYWMKAGMKGLMSSSYEEAISHFQHGIDTIGDVTEAPHLGGMLVGFKLLLGSAILARRGYVEELEGIYEEARGISAEHDPSQMSTVLASLYTTYYGRGKLDKALEVATELLDITRKSGDLAGQIYGLEFVAYAHFLMGEYVEAKPVYDEQNAIEEQPDPESYMKYVMATFHDGVQYGFTFGSWVYLSMGYPEIADRWMQRAYEMAKAHQNMLIRMNGIFMTATLHAFNREYDRARTLVLEVLHLAEEHLVPFWIGPGDVLLGLLDSRAGRHREGYELAKEGIPIVRVSALTLGYQLTLFAETCLAAGEIQEGLDAIDEALQFMAETNERWWEAETYRVRGMLLAAYDESSADDTVEAFETAIDVARRQQARMLEIRARVSYAMTIPEDRNRVQTILDGLRELCDSLSEGHDQPDVVDAMALIADMNSADLT